MAKFINEEHTQVSSELGIGPLEHYLDTKMGGLMIPYPLLTTRGNPYKSEDESDEAYARLRNKARKKFLDEIEPYKKYEDTSVAKERLIPEIKQAARSKILQIANEDKQRNMIAEALQIMIARMAYVATLNGAPKTEGDDAKLESFMSSWEQINTIRTASNEAEASLDEKTLEELSAINASDLI